MLVCKIPYPCERGPCPWASFHWKYSIYKFMHYFCYFFLQCMRFCLPHPQHTHRAIDIAYFREVRASVESQQPLETAQLPLPNKPSHWMLCYSCESLSICPPLDAIQCSQGTCTGECMLCVRVHVVCVCVCVCMCVCEDDTYIVM